MGFMGFHFDYVTAIALVVPLLLLGHHFQDRIGIAGRSLWGILAGFVGFVWCVRIVKLMVSRVTDPVHWDFLNFWIYGRLIHAGRNIYDPASYADFPLPLERDPTHTAEALQVGCVYPPTSVPLWWPLGWFDYAPAYALWYLASVVAIGGTAWLLSRAFPDGRRGWMTAALTLVLLLILRPTLLSVNYGQSQFFFLLAIVLAWTFRRSFGGGLAVAAATVVKPVAVLIAPWFVLQRRWSGLLGMAAGLFAAAGAGLLLIGPEAFVHYLTDPPADRFPEFVYTQGLNQSLLAVSLRLVDRVAPPGAIHAYAPFVVPAILLYLFAAWAAWRDRSGAGWGFLALLSAALMIYPGATRPYALLAILPAVALWHDRHHWPGAPWSMVVLLTALFGLHAWHDGETGFVAHTLALAAVSLRALGVVRTRPTTDTPSARARRSSATVAA